MLYERSAKLISESSIPATHAQARSEAWSAVTEPSSEPTFCERASWQQHADVRAAQGHRQLAEDEARGAQPH